MVIIWTLSFLLIISIFLNIKERRYNKKILADLKSMEESRNASLEYIDALWQSQKSMILNQRVSSLNSLVDRISHEINTPLGNALTSLTHLEEIISKDSKLSVEARPSMNVCLNSIHRSISLVNAFSELSFGKNFDSPVFVSISELLDYTCSTNKFVNTEILIEEDFNVNVSPINLSLALRKILDNAYDFKCNKSEHLVKIVAKKIDNDLIIEIEDNGKGITSKDLDNIFNPLYTTRSGKELHGLGLAIAYNIITSHYSGEITCSSELEVGTKFTIKIPKVLN